MQKIGLVDGRTIDIVSIQAINGNLEIGLDMPEGEVRKVFREKANLQVIELLTDGEMKSGEQVGYTCYGGYMEDTEGIKHVTLNREADKDAALIVEALAKAIMAMQVAESAKQGAESVQGSTEGITEQLTDLQLAVVELYENMWEVGR